MINAVQRKIDTFLSAYYLPSILDIQYFEADGEVIIFRNRKKGKLNIILDVSDLATPQEILERILNHPAIESQKMPKENRFRINYI